MADPIDLANDLNEKLEKELALALEIRRKAEATVGTEFCVECGDEMPKERQKLGFQKCVPCVQENERRQALFMDH